MHRTVSALYALPSNARVCSDNMIDASFVFCSFLLLSLLLSLLLLLLSLFVPLFFNSMFRFHTYYRTDCGRFGVCVDVAGGYQCKCKPGFKGDAANNKPVKCTFDAASVRPKDGYKDYKGLLAKMGKSYVSLGDKSDVIIARTGDRKLLLDADVDVAGKMSVKGLDLDVELKRVHDQEAVLASLRKQLYQQAKANMQFLWKADESLVFYSRFETMKDLSQYGNHPKPSATTKIQDGGKYCKVSLADS